MELIQQRTQPITTMLDVCTTNLSQKLTELLLPILSASQPKLPTIVVKPAQQPVQQPAQQPQKPVPQADNSDKMHYNDRTVSIQEISKLAAQTTAVSFTKCLSKEWQQIGEKLATLPSLGIIEMKDCDAGDVFCAAIATSRSLRQMTLGTTQLTQETAASGTKE